MEKSSNGSQRTAISDKAQQCPSHLIAVSRGETEILGIQRKWTNEDHVDMSHLGDPCFIMMKFETTSFERSSAIEGSKDFAFSSACRHLVILSWIPVLETVQLIKHIIIPYYIVENCGKHNFEENWYIQKEFFSSFFFVFVYIKNSSRPILQQWSNQSYDLSRYHRSDTNQTYQEKNKESHRTNRKPEVSCESFKALAGSACTTLKYPITIN